MLQLATTADYTYKPFVELLDVARSHFIEAEPILLADREDAAPTRDDDVWDQEEDVFAAHGADAEDEEEYVAMYGADEESLKTDSYDGRRRFARQALGALARRNEGTSRAIRISFDAPVGRTTRTRRRARFGQSRRPRAHVVLAPARARANLARVQTTHARRLRPRRAHPSGKLTSRLRLRRHASRSRRVRRRAPS